ncbi:protein kinase [Acidobacteriota bacterium]
MECPNSSFCKKCATSLIEEAIEGGFLTKTLETPSKGIILGTTLAFRYKVIEELGRGGMGVVYKAEDAKLKRTVAVKLLPPELMGDKEARERFMREAQSAAFLDHPNICTIYEMDETEDQTFISMAYVDGQNLREKVKEGPLSVNDGLDIAIQASEGLAAAHDKGIIHRDIKSANIMVTKQGQAKIMDFGLAKFAGASLITREGVTMGTLAYMSPEQAQGKVVDRRSDIWSLGVVLYEMFGDRLPFQGNTEASYLYSIVHESPAPLKEIKPDIPEEIQKVITRALKKKPEDRYDSASDMAADLKRYQGQVKAEEAGLFNLRTLLRRLRKPRYAIPLAAAIILLTAATVWYFNRQAKIRWAREEIIPEVERLIEESFADLIEPYNLAVKAEEVVPNDPKLAELFSRCSLSINIITEPAGADIYKKVYKSPENEWEYLGVSPLENVRMPIGFFRWKIEKEGYETVFAASTSWDVEMVPKDKFVPSDLARVLDEKGTFPEGMTRVTGTQTPVGELGDFFIDRHEVTNRQYKEFIDSGGYRKREYWIHEMIKGGGVLTWEEAVAEFVDQSGRPGPATWMAGDYPEEQDDYPVSGVSWYEAAAYAEYAGKTLPTGHHWGIARGEYTPMIMWPQAGGYAIFAPFSNFQDKGPVSVGSLMGVTSYGAVDMAGNVREWCSNTTQMGRLVRGGAWNDNVYQFRLLSQADPFERSPKNGFRCALYPEPENIPDAALQAMEYNVAIDIAKEELVPDSIFEVYKEQFSYDRTELNARVEAKDESSEYWIKERISFDAAYGDERIIGVLFLPKNIEPPYQTVIYWPGEQAFPRSKSEELDKDMEFQLFLSFIVKNGRAALYPVYKGTMERSNSQLLQLMFGTDFSSHLYTEYLIQLGKDFRRCVDYLEARQDIDSTKLAYYGMSWGAVMAPIITAIEERLKASILLAGGFQTNGIPPRAEANEINYITRVKVPTLMLNGRYDSLFPLEAAIIPMYDMLGTPDEHKALKLYDTDHIPPKNEFIKETLAWLDKYLGPVNK